MIVVKILGGLGNQMFQYAAARRLAAEKGVALKLDVSAFESYTLRTYKLDHYDIAAEIATPADCNRLIVPGVLGKAQRLAERRLLPRHRRHIYYEQKQYQFETAILNTPRNVYLQGYFQNEGYFKAVEPLIRREFTVKAAPNAANRAMAEQIRSVDAVSLHIRRGDYANDPKTLALHGVLPLSYYRAAIDRLVERVTEPHFFIFSDDPAWAHEHLQLAYPLTLVDHNDAQHDYEDLRLMSLCQHHIIANSSFSWWGAWLCSYPSKSIYAPERWLLDDSIDTRDAVPPTWIRLPVQEN